MNISFSISKNNEVYKLNTRHQCPCHLLCLDHAAEKIHKLLQLRSWTSSAGTVHLHNKKASPTQFTYQELVKNKDNDRFELNNIFYIEEKYIYI